MTYHNSPEARAKQLERRLRRNAQGMDLLAERERKIKFWKDAAKTNPLYAPHNGAWWWVFTWSGSFRRLLLPKLRAQLDARDRAWKERCAADMRAYSEKWQAEKAARAQAKKAAKQAAKPRTPQTMDLFA